MRLTIARKIALAVVGIVIVCIGTMAWVTSTNLQRGFLAYLNEMQAQDVEQLAGLLAERYRREGDFEWLRGQPRALRDVLDSMKMQLQTEPDGPRPRPRPRDWQDGQGGRRPPPRELPFDQRPLPDRADQRPPHGFPPPPDERRPPPERQPPPGARDPMGFASRLTVLNAAGEAVMGPPDVNGGIERAIVVDGREVGKVRLRPLRQAAGSGSSATVFLREQLRETVWLACGLIILSVLLAVGLARHLLRPVAALRAVTEKLARGQFDARAPLLSRDELAELALHVNAMAQSLEESERKRRKLLADVSHELRTPITVIRGEIEALLDGIRQADGRALESLHAEVLHLTKLVEDLHQLTLADAGDLQYHWQEVELAALIEPLLERFSGRAGDAGLKLAWQLPEQDLRITADCSRLTQVLVNLLENSVRYTDSGGRIELVLTQDGEFAEITIDDSAPDVPQGQHANIFERLYKVDAARTRERGGSGLGLAICRVLVEGHGGTIVALPSQLGGLRMRIRLPLAKPLR